jgi:hypothetical protein
MTPTTSRSHHATHSAARLAPSLAPARHKLATPTLAPIMVLGPMATKANFATPAGVSKVRTPSDQISIR